MAKQAQAENTKRVRRSTEEVKESRLAREENLANKAAARAARLAAAAEAATARAARSQEKMAAIAANTPVTKQRAEPATIKDSAAKKITREVTDFFKRLGAEHGMDFSDITPRMTKRGAALSVRVTGQMAGAVAATKRAVGATREAARFLANHKLIGLKASVLEKEVQLAGDKGTYKVLGLRGRAHDVVLQQVGTDKQYTVAADDFKTRMVSV